MSRCSQPLSLQVNSCDVPELPSITTEVTFIKPFLCVKPSPSTDSLAPPNNFWRQVLFLISSSLRS